MKAGLTRSFIAMACLLSGCQSSAPDASRFAQEQVAYEDARIVINALRRFHRAHHVYPTNLAALSPRYLPAGKLNGNQYDLARTSSLLAYYPKDGTTYELDFGLSFPGLPPKHYIRYSYSSISGHWSSAETITFATVIARPPRIARAESSGLCPLAC